MFHWRMKPAGLACKVWEMQYYAMGSGSLGVETGSWEKQCRRDASEPYFTQHRFHLGSKFWRLLFLLQVWSPTWHLHTWLTLSMGIHFSGLILIYNKDFRPDGSELVWVLKMWPVWIKMLCNCCKIHTEFGRLCEKKNIKYR